MADGKSLKEQNSGLIARYDDRTYRRLRVDRCQTAAPSFDERAARSRRVSRRQQHRDDYGLSDDTLAMARLGGLGQRALIHRGANLHMTGGKNIQAVPRRHGSITRHWYLRHIQILMRRLDGDATNPERYCTAIR